MRSLRSAQNIVRASKDLLRASNLLLLPRDDPHVNEATWLQAMKPGSPPYTKLSLKKAVYGDAAPKVEKFTKQKEKIDAQIEVIRNLTKNRLREQMGFGKGWARLLLAWKPSLAGSKACCCRLVPIPAALIGAFRDMGGGPAELPGPEPSTGITGHRP